MKTFKEFKSELKSKQNPVNSTKNFNRDPNIITKDSIQISPLEIAATPTKAVY